MKANKDTIISFVCGLTSIIVLWAIWELTTALGWQYARVLPPPSQFLADFADSGFKIGLGSQAASVPESVASSFFRVFMGLSIGFVAAITFGVLVSMDIWVKRFGLPIVELLAPIAPIAWIPIALVLFGIGNQTAIFIVFMGVFFILTIVTVKLISTVPQHLINVARTLGYKNYQIWLYVIIPYILPGVFTMLRINFIAAWMAVLAAEMTGLRDGLGAIVMTGRNLFNSDLILLGMCLIGISGFIIDVILRFIQNKFFWWDTNQGTSAHK